MKKSYIIIAVVLIVTALVGIAWMAQRDDIPETREEAVQETELQPEAEEAEANDEDTEAAEHAVIYTESGFEPSELTINEGDTVTFRNTSGRNVHVASDPHPSHTDYPEFDAGRGYGPNESFSFTFDRSGEWGFHNHLNPVHTGIVIVR